MLIRTTMNQDENVDQTDEPRKLMLSVEKKIKVS